MSGPIVLVLRILLTVSLYVFLVWAFIGLWRDLKMQSVLLSGRYIPPISLAISTHDQTPQNRHFVQAEVTIGRDPACECPVDDTAISARHACLSFHHNQWWLEDLNSTNGTLINQEKLTLPTVLVSGDEFRCGATSFTVKQAGDIRLSSVNKID